MYDNKIKEAESLFEEGDYKKAIVIYTKLLKGKNNIDIHFELGRCYFKIKDYASAQKEWLKVLENEPHNQSVLYNLALIHNLSEQDDSALHYLNKFLKINPNDSDAKNLKAKIQNIHRGETPYLTYTLIGLNVLIFFFINLGNNVLPTIMKYSFSGSSLEQGIFSQIITSMFVHGSIWHLLFNLLALFSFGRILEAGIGTKKFAILYFGSGIFGAILQANIGPATHLVGASGAIFGLIGTISLLIPLLPISIFFIIKRPVIEFTAIYAVFVLVIDAGKGIGGIAHFAHLGGLILGIVFSFIIDKERAKDVIFYWIGIFGIIYFCASYVIVPLIQSYPFGFGQGVFIKFLLGGASFGIVKILIDKLNKKGYGVEENE